MDEAVPSAPEAPANPAPSGELTQGDVLREQATAANASAEQKAGEITTQLVSDGHGGFLTPSEASAELAHRQDHGGQGSNETATRI